MTADSVNKIIEIVESSYLPTPCGKGMRLRCLTQEVSGPTEGSLTHLDFALEHDDPSIQADGQRAFAHLRRAVGVLNPQDSAEMHFKAFAFPFGLEPADPRRAAA